VKRALETVRSAWAAFWFSPGPASTLGTCRLLFFGALFLWQLPHDYSPWGAYSSVFWMPIWLFDTFGIPPLSPHALAIVQIVWKASLFLSAVGLFTRAAMAVAFVIGAYLMGLPHNFGQTQHFDTLVVFASGALALSRAGDAVSVDSLVAAYAHPSTDPPADHPEYTWPIRFVWVAMALAFGAAGLAKLRHSGLEWIFSDNLALLLLRQQYHLSDGEPLTRWGIWVANHKPIAQAMAGSSVAIETLFPLALFSRRARYVLVPAGLAFLVGIRMLMGPTFEQFMMCYVFWLPWARLAALVRERVVFGAERLVVYDAGCGLCSRTAAVLSRLDRFARLRYADVNADWSILSAAYPSLDRNACVADMHVIVNPGGDARWGRTSIRSGFDAYRSMAWVLPLAWIALPILYLPGVPSLGRRIYKFTASHRSTTTCPVPAPTAE
jgi:predicted DCC family thiol-disulfide oxidoreductase YuxK